MPPILTLGLTYVNGNVTKNYILSPYFPRNSSRSDSRPFPLSAPWSRHKSPAPRTPPSPSPCKNAGPAPARTSPRTGEPAVKTMQATACTGFVSMECHVFVHDTPRASFTSTASPTTATISFPTFPHCGQGPLWSTAKSDPQCLHLADTRSALDTSSSIGFHGVEAAGLCVASSTMTISSCVSS